MSYGLDPVGNRSSESSSLPDIPSGSFSFNADDELSSETYDPNGNVTAPGGKTFTYDSQNQMLSMTASGTAVSMTYDAFGNRVAKPVNGSSPGLHGGAQAGRSRLPAVENRGDTRDVFSHSVKAR